MMRKKQMYTRREGIGKEKLQIIMNALALFLIVTGIFGTLISIDRFAILVKPAIDFNRLLNYPAGSGDHIEGRLLYTYGCFAEPAVISTEYGRKTGETKN